MKMIREGRIPNREGGVFIDAYNQSINEDIAMTIYDLCNGDMRYKGREIHPYESFYWNESPAFVRGILGGGISRCVKCDDSLATMVIDEDGQDDLLE